MRAALFLFILFALRHCSAQCGDPIILEGSSSLTNARLQNEVHMLVEYSEVHDTVPVHLVDVPGTVDGEDRVRFQGEGVTVTIQSARFDSTKHQINYTPHHYVCTIDGRPILGTDGEVPREGIQALSVAIDGTSVQLPDSAWKDLFNPNLYAMPARSHAVRWYDHVVRSSDRDHVLVHMTNSDGAGGYDVVWIFVKGAYFRRVIEMP